MHMAAHFTRIRPLPRSPTTLLSETVRSSQREIGKGVRDLDRELLALKREEQKLIAEIKAAAKANNQPAARVLAKSLVRLRAQMSKLQGSQANLRGVSTNLTTAVASTTVAQSMGTATAAMSKMQQQMNPAKVMDADALPVVAFTRPLLSYTSHTHVVQQLVPPPQHVHAPAGCRLPPRVLSHHRSTRRCSSFQRRMHAWRWRRR